MEKKIIKIKQEIFKYNKLLAVLSKRGKKVIYSMGDNTLFVTKYLY